MGLERSLEKRQLKIREASAKKIERMCEGEGSRESVPRDARTKRRVGRKGREGREEKDDDGCGEKDRSEKWRREAG